MFVVAEWFCCVCFSRVVFFADGGRPPGDQPLDGTRGVRGYGFATHKRGRPPRDDGSSGDPFQHGQEPFLVNALPVILGSNGGEKWLNNNVNMCTALWFSVQTENVAEQRTGTGKEVAQRYRNTLGDKITHPLGRISDPVSSKTLGGGHTQQNWWLRKNSVEKVA